MDHHELVALIEKGVEGSDWAELGAGAGNFTAALADVLGPGGRIVAVDRDAGALRSLSQRLPEVRVVRADFIRPLGLGGLDGVLMANSLHFVRDKAPVLAAVRAMLRSGGTLLMVEYDSDRGNPWVPHPFSYATWQRLAEAAGFRDTRLLATRPGRHLGGMYAAASRAQ